LGDSRMCRVAVSGAEIVFWRSQLCDSSHSRSKKLYRTMTG
jgi:hypothetical protein